MIRIGMLVLTLALGGARWAYGQEPAADAGAHRARGNLLLAEKKYDEAIAEYRAGFAIDHDPRFLYNIGQAQRLGGRCGDAIGSYQAFLATDPPDDQAALASTNMASCREKAEVPKAPAATVPVVPAPAISAPASGNAWYKDAFGDVLLGGGIATLLVGTVVWSGARSDVDDANAAARAARNYDEFRQAQARAQDAEGGQTVGVALMIAGTALAAGGVVRYLLRPTREAGGTVAAAPVRGGGMLVVAGSF